MSYKSFNNDRTLYRKFLGVLIKKGNSTRAKAIFDKAFLIMSKKTGRSKEAILLKLFISLNSFVEVRKIRIKRRSFLIPFSIGIKRRSYLIIRWLMQAVKENVKKDSLPNKLSNEILNVIGGVFTHSKKLKKLNISQAISNRSNIHYRW